MLFVTQRTDCATFAPAAQVDRAYAEALWRAHDAGVHMACIVARIDERGVRFAGTLPIDLER